MAAEPPTAREMQSRYERWWQFVCGWVCASARRTAGATGGKKNISIKIVHQTIKLLCAGSQVLWLRLHLPLFPRVSPLPPPSPHLSFDHCPFLFRGLTPSVASHTHTHTNTVSVFSPPFFLSFPPWVSSRLWSASQTCTSLSPVLFLLYYSSVFLSRASYKARTFVPLDFPHCLFPYVLSCKHTYLASTNRKPTLVSFTRRYETKPSHQTPARFMSVWSEVQIKILDKQSSTRQKAWIWHQFSVTFHRQRLIEDLKEIKI